MPVEQLSEDEYHSTAGHEDSATMENFLEDCKKTNAIVMSRSFGVVAVLQRQVIKQLIGFACPTGPIAVLCKSQKAVKPRAKR